MFSENYSVCLNDDGSPREIERNGPVVTYKAIGFDSGRAVAMQLVPLANIDEVERIRFEEAARMAQKAAHANFVKVFDVGIEHEHFVFVCEYLEGDTADAWIRAHGPMPPDAVLRVGLQVVDALAVAASHTRSDPSFHSTGKFAHSSRSGGRRGWPRIKIRNFGVPGLKLQSDEHEMRELVPPMPVEFSSPEQVRNGGVDFRSDLFSLGATMWFLLTGTAPVAAATEPGPRLATGSSTVPRFVRNLVGRMLRTNPEERPQDPVALAEKIHACLQKAERQTAFTRSFAPAAIPTLAKPEKKRVARALALAASVALLAALGVFYFSRSQRESKPLGVIIGVPETTEVSPASVSASPPTQLAVNQTAQELGTIAQASPPQTASPPTAEVAADKVSSAPQLAANNRTVEPPGLAQSPAVGSHVPSAAKPSVAEKSESRRDEVTQQSNTQSASPPATELTAGKRASEPQLAVNNRMAEPPTPAEGPSETRPPPSMVEPLPAEKTESTPTDIPERPEVAARDSSSAAAQANEPPNSSEPVVTKKRGDSGASKTKTRSRRQRLAKSSARPLPPLRVGSESARVVATTSNGNWVLRLPSGERIVTPPVPNIDDAPVISPRRVRRVLRPMPLEDQSPVIVLPPGL